MPFDLNLKGAVLKPSFATLILLGVLASCGPEQDRQEVISKLRGLGVEQTPVNATPGQTVQLVYHLIAPKGLTVAAQPYTDTAFRYGVNAPVTLTDLAPVSEDVGALTHYTLRAQFVVPSDALTLAAVAAKGSARVRYGVQFTAPGDDETIVTDSVVYAAGAPELAWTAPTIAIAQPVGANISSETPLQATVQSTNAEINKLSWFMSGGKVKSRRAISTEWTEIPSGIQTLILTTRGDKSTSFAIKIAQVTVN